MTQPKRILFCRCAHSEAVPEATRAAVQAHLDGTGLAFEGVDDLCGLAARRDPALQALARSAGLTVVACYPRAVTWLFEYAQASLKGRDIQFLNMRTQTPEAIVQALKEEGQACSEASCGCCAATDGAESAACKDASCKNAEASKAPDWMPWFPVIDYDACTGCKQCLNFCLFDVYRLSDEGRVEVANPANCKTHCPACARVCPHQAIIFPKYKAGVLSGDALTSNGTCPCDNEAAAMLANLLDGDIYAGLKARDKPAGRRFSTDPDPQEAQKRCACVGDLTDKLDIPLSVLQSLSPQEMASLSSRSKTDNETAMTSASEETEAAGENACDCNCDCDCDCSPDSADQNACACDCSCKPEKDAPGHDTDASTGRRSCC